MNPQERLARHLQQTFHAQLGPAFPPASPAPSADALPTPATDRRTLPAATTPPRASLASLFTCQESEFPAAAVHALLGHHASVAESVHLSELRAKGESRAALVRTLLEAGSRAGLPSPADWMVALPRHIDVSGLRSPSLPKAEFVRRAYQMLLLRSPSPAEVEAQVRGLRWHTRSDFLVAMANSHEACRLGGEAVLVGLGRQRPSLRRLFQALRGPVTAASQKALPDAAPWTERLQADAVAALGAQLEPLARLPALVAALGTQLEPLRALPDAVAALHGVLSGMERLPDLVVAVQDRLAKVEGQLCAAEERTESEAAASRSIQQEVRSNLDSLAELVAALAESVNGLSSGLGALGQQMATVEASAQQVVPSIEQVLRVTEAQATRMQQALEASLPQAKQMEQVLQVGMAQATHLEQVLQVGMAQATHLEQVLQVGMAQATQMEQIGGKLDSAAVERYRILDVQEAQAATLAQFASQLRPPVVPGDEVVVVEVDGFLLGVRSSEWRASAYYHLRGPMEPGVYTLLRHLIRPGMAVADLGANVGLYTLLAARMLGGDGRIVSVEPTPQTFRILCENVQLNGFRESGIVTLHNVAAADCEGHTRLWTSPADSTHNSLHPMDGLSDSLEVRCVTLDSLLGPRARLDLVKIDVEGAEPQVLRGMAGLLDANPHLQAVLEFAPGHLRHAGAAPRDFLDQIARLGFRPRLIDDATGELLPAVPETLLSRENSNLLLVRS